MPGVNYVINGWSSLRTSSGAWNWRINIVAVVTQDRMIDDNLKSQIKNQTLHT